MNIRESRHWYPKAASLTPCVLPPVLFLFSDPRVQPSRKHGHADEDDELVGFLQDYSQFAEVVEAEDLEANEPLDVSVVQRKGWSAPDVDDCCFRLTALPECAANAFDQQDISIVCRSENIAAFPPLVFRCSVVGTHCVLDHVCFLYPQHFLRG